MNDIKESRKVATKLQKTCKYLYGAKLNKYTTYLVNKLAKLYPSVYTANIKKLALQDADKGYYAIDCSGYVCQILGIKDKGSTALHDEAVKILDVDKAKAKEGMCIWKKGHIAYIGEDLKIYEASSTASDMKVTDFDKRASSFSKMLVIKGSYLADHLNDKSKKSIHDIALECIKGIYGNGEKRKKALKALGYDWKAVQEEVNRIMK